MVAPQNISLLIKNINENNVKHNGSCGNPPFLLTFETVYKKPNGILSFDGKISILTSQPEKLGSLFIKGANKNLNGVTTYLF